MARYVIGAIGDLLGALTGTWLMLARPGQPQGNASGLENNIEQVLLPLITAMLKDMQDRDRERDGARQGDSHSYSSPPSPCATRHAP
jgi:hypothetical protein